jgi:hypothetical protein
LIKKVVFAMLLAASAQAAPGIGKPPASSSAGGGAAPPPITVVATPIFGTEATVGKGWYDVLVRVDNPQPAAKKGTLELYDSTPYHGPEPGVTTHAPFNVPAGKSAYVRLETHGPPYGTPAMMVRAKDEKGEEIVNVSVTLKNEDGPVLVDIDEPSKLSIVMRGWPATVTFGTATPLYYMGTTTPTTIGFASPQFDHATGDPILPARAAGWGATTVVLAHSDMLARLQGPELDALINWISAGGTIAVIPNRPEDLRGSPLSALIGGTAVSGTPAPGLLTLPTTPRPMAPGAAPGWGTGGGGLMVPDDEEEGWNPDDAKPGDFIPIRTSTGGAVHLGPRAAVAAKMIGYTGGNLAATVYGSTASYGLGEVHLLPFDPTTPPALDDPWVQGRIADMVNHAWDRRAPVAFPPQSIENGMPHRDEVRRALDPNENFRPALGFAAIVLALYSIFVGPVVFLRARKKDKPLMPLTWAPLLSIGAFGSIVLAGLAVKGWTGRSRQIAMVETGAGFTRASARRYRGFFTSEAKGLRIGATDSASVIDTVHFDSLVSQDSSLSVDRDGLSLDKITSLPWQTLVVREDGFMDLKGPVAVVKNDLGTTPNATVANKTGRDLLDVIVYVPLDGARYVGTIKNGDKADSSKGTFLWGSSSRRATSAGSATVHMLDSTSLGIPLPKKDGDRVTATWHLAETSTDETVDWWPDDSPVVLAEMNDPEHPATDSGLRVESERLLLRVVGYGGSP